MFILKNKKLHIVIELYSKIPAVKYGGTERVVWDLGKALVEKGHKVTFLVAEGSFCDFAEVIFRDVNLDINAQIPVDADLVHLNFKPKQDVNKPHLITVHGNPNFGEIQAKQSVFVSKNHALRYNSEVFVHNGLDWRNYPKPDFTLKRSGFHFLANAAWKIKNLKGALSITKKAHQKLNVLGGFRFNFKMGWRFTFDAHASFKGMVDNQNKAKFLNHSHGLIFPVLWDEPFGLAIIESLYYGCPVFATPYGSLPELITNSYGFLSDSEEQLVAAIKNYAAYDAQKCYEYAAENFSSKAMANAYLKLYERVLNGEVLNEMAPQLKEEKKAKYLPYS